MKNKNEGMGEMKTANNLENGAGGQIFTSSNEKIIFDAICNLQNDRWFCQDLDDVPRFLQSNSRCKANV